MTGAALRRWRIEVRRWTVVRAARWAGVCERTWYRYESRAHERIPRPIEIRLTNSLRHARRPAKKPLQAVPESPTLPSAEGWSPSATLGES